MKDPLSRRLDRRTLLSAALSSSGMAVLLLAGCGTSTTTPRPAAGPSSVGASPTVAVYPMTVTDGLGREVRLEKQPQRIISYQPSNTEVLYAVGAGDRIVGVDEASDYPPEAKAKPKVGSGVGQTVSLEALVALLPDLVVSTGRTPDFPTLLESSKIPVVAMTYKDINGTLANVELMGKVVGKAAEGAKLAADMRARMEAVQAKTKPANKVRVFYDSGDGDPGKLWTPGPGSFVHDLLVMAGAQNIAAGGTGGFYQISAEEVVKSNPELIVVPVGPYSPPNPTSPARYAQRPGWEGIEAVKKQAIAGIDVNLLHRPGPRLVDGLDALARAVHPELFK